MARHIAAAVRASRGGLPFVKALGIRLEDRGIVQVSMNLTNYQETPIFRVFDTVAREAARHGVAILGSEIVGLAPVAALIAAAEHYLRLDRFTEDRLLETEIARGQQAKQILGPLVLGPECTVVTKNQDLA